MRTNDALPLLVAGIFCCTASAAGATDNVGEFYRNKEIRVIVSSGPGGVRDLYARTIARHMGKHIPGNPGFIVQTMDGAGSRTAANWLYNIAPKDGTVIGAVSQNVALDQARKQEGVRFDVTRYGWIGNPIADDNLVTNTWKEAGLTTIDDIKSRGGLICGGSGASAAGIVNAQILRNLLGASIRIIAGYSGDNNVRLAMERGELNCNASSSWGSMRTEASEYLSAHKLNMIVQWGPTKNPAVSAYQGRDVPMISELAGSEIDKKVLNLVTSGVTFGRPLLVPPGVPPERLEALRTAFDATMKDPDFLDEAAKQTMDVSPASGATLQQLARDVTAASDDVLARANELMTSKDGMTTGNKN